jgi:molecular chaperone GrpE
MSDESAEGRTTATTADDDGPPDGGDAAEPDEIDGDAEYEDDADLAARVEEYDADLAAEVADLASRRAELESELDAKAERVDELENALARSKADFKNYKKRAKRREEEIRERATEDFVGRIVSVRDNLVRALDQEEGADIRPGVESTVEEFDRILAEENVTEIVPEPGSDVDPTRHEVLMRVDADQPEGTVAEVYRPGYEMAGSVLREAQVTVSEGASGGGDGGNDAGS